MHKDEAKALCKKHMHRYVMAQMNDGAEYDGIVESVDDENVYLAVPVGEVNAPAPMYQMPAYGAPAAQGCSPCGDSPGYDYRTIGAYGGYGAGGFGYGYPGYGTGIPGYGYGVPGYGTPGYGYPGYGRRRRFSRLALPFAALAALSLLPYY
jgi:hypothetical protein